jgi:hypothetical protein
MDQFYVYLVLKNNNTLHIKIARPYAWNDSRTAVRIFMKFDTGEFYYRLASNFNFRLDQILHEDHIGEKIFLKALSRQMERTFYAQNAFSISLKVVEIMRQNGCHEYILEVSYSVINHGSSVGCLCYRSPTPRFHPPSGLSQDSSFNLLRKIYC